MAVIDMLIDRSGNVCELCGNTNNLSSYEVPPESDGSAEQCLLVCDTCKPQLENPGTEDVHHWRCLNDCMWSELPAVQVVSWRMLNRLSSEQWATDALENLYLDEETLVWAESLAVSVADAVIHRDCHGVVLEGGDTVHITKDLNVKGSSMAAKRGTAVRNISLVHNNAKQIEGRVNGQHIVILTEFVKKA